MGIDTSIDNEDMCLPNSATTHTILKNNKFFSNLVMQEINISTISGTTNIIEGSGRANILLPGGMKLHIKNTLYSSNSYRNLLSFNDIRLNEFHIETNNEWNVKYFYITKLYLNKKEVLEKLPTFSYGLYCTYVNTVETHILVNKKFYKQ
uniref:Retrovirus-related Pol polyprotein from transposon TNT 1-94 n=1 Tax=Cajanus cajan TaxID=3821 RepID=A0A151QVM0_CAJCA|nr:hypothetical protein KK1_044725 [Cajanus cajan]